jgi:FtsP/CotA-like multicopper oxidase with cupredoxin domain
MRAGFPRRRDEHVAVPTARSRLIITVLALLIGGAGYVALPSASATPPSGVRLGNVPSTNAPLNGAVIVGPGGASTGYYTKVAVIAKGGTLQFINLDELAHTVTSVARRPDGKPLFSGNALPGKTVQVTGVSKLPPGTYDFYCQYHPNMTGTLIIEGAKGKPVKPTQQSFPTALHPPKVLTGSHITIPVKNANVRVLPGGPKTRMWTFDGSYPGPTIKRPAGHKTKVTFVNHLTGGVGPITIHLHGDHHASANDGLPDSHLIRAGKRRTYTYPLTDGGKPEPSAFEFYHDHRMGETGRDNWNGLSGMFIITRKGERKLDLPSGKYDVPLDVADRSFDNLNQLTEPFPTGVQTLPSKLSGTYSPPGDATVGSDILVDGRYRPHLDVSAHRYRFRILNSSNFQSYDFALSDGRPLTQIGTGSGLLPHPVVRNDIMLGPAQRADVVVNFHGLAHKRVILKSIPRSDDDAGGIGTPSAPIMAFRVGHQTPDHTKVPASLPSAPAISAPAAPTAMWTFGLGGSARRGTFWTVNGQPYNPKRVDETVPLGSTQTWLLTNLSTTTHFIHIHEEEWHTLLRDGQPPPPYEKGLVDTWRLDPGESVEVAANFSDYTGVFMIHCHMLDHEDHGMMAQFAVVKPGSKALPRGYFMGTGPAMPTSLATMPFGAAIETAANAANRVRVTSELAATGMQMGAARILPARLAAGTSSMAGMSGGDAMTSDEMAEGPAPHWMRLLIRVGWVLSIEVPLLALILLWRRRREVDDLLLRSFSILMLAGVAITHASDWLDKLEEAPYIAVGFGLLIAGSGVCALAVATWRRTRLVDDVGAIMSALTIAAYLYSRSIGLPEIPDHIGHWVDAWGNASLVVEAALVVVALRRFLPRRVRDWRPLDPTLHAVLDRFNSPPATRGTP